MIIICNGAFKSGSTWLYLIVEELLKLKKVSFNEEINTKWVSTKNNNFLFSDSSIHQAIPAYQQKKGAYLSKTHLLEKESYKFLKDSSGDVKVLFIARNLGDAVISHYHHVITQTGKKISFNKYYKMIGRYKAKEITTFDENRLNYLPNTLYIKFENLKNDFDNQVKDIAAELGFTVLQEEIDFIKEETSLNKLKDKAKKGELSHYSKNSEKASKLFRKGRIGESEKLLNDNQKNDLDKIEKNKTSLFFNMYYIIFFKWRRKLYKM